MERFVGTSGWSYSWNEGRSLEWYVEQSGLNAIELNASFYRIPLSSQVDAWKKKGGALDWTVKVNRSVTHRHFLNAAGIAFYGRFLEAFQSLDPRISYYLFQFPPRFSTAFSGRIRDLVLRFPSAKMAFEFRHPSWEEVDFDALGFDGVVVTPDSPDHPGSLFVRKGRIYLRFHGRKNWYTYRYSEEELREIADRAIRISPRVIHAFFNNDHNMLDNARLFLTILDGFPEWNEGG